MGPLSSIKPRDNVEEDYNHSPINSYRVNRPSQGRGPQGKVDKCPPGREAMLSADRNISVQLRRGIRQT